MPDDKVDDDARGAGAPRGVPPRPAQPPATMYLVKTVESAIRQHLARVLPAGGISVSETIALSLLRQLPTISSSELARRTFVTPQTMQAVVASLEAKGLIDRRRNEDNRREVLLSVTPAGHEAMELVNPGLRGIEDAARADLSDAEHAQFRDLLDRVRRSLFAALPDGSRPLAHTDAHHGGTQ